MAQQLFSRQFTFIPEQKRFVAEASDLGITAAAGSSWFQPIYNDAVDVGFYMRSHKTGKVCAFALKGEIKKDDELLGWEFEAVRPHASMFVKEFAPWHTCDGVTAVIFND